MTAPAAIPHLHADDLAKATVIVVGTRHQPTPKLPRMISFEF